MFRTLLIAALAVTPMLVNAASPEELAALAVASVKASPKWDRVEVQRAKADDYALIIWYKVDPASYGEVERDTKTVGRAMLHQLVTAKAIPSGGSGRIAWVVVRGRMPERGETGKSLTRVFGQSRWNSDDDQFKFERPK